MKTNLIKKDIKRVVRTALSLTEEEMKEVMLASDIFMSAVQKSAKLRAPRWTGALAKSIRKHAPTRGTESGNIVITVDSPYGAVQEYGFRKHGVGGAWATRKGRVFAEWLHMKGLPIGGAKVQKAYNPSGYFVGPAVEINLSNLPNLLNQHLAKAIKGGK